MTSKQRTGRRERERGEAPALRAFARSAVYRLLSQSLVYPTDEAVGALVTVDLPAARALAPALGDALAGLVAQLSQQLEGQLTLTLQQAHQRTFPHVESGDCPLHETVFTTQNLFQQTQELSDLSGFFRAFGLELVERERPDHMSVELEFMYVLTYKEGYAWLHHGSEKARLCRIVQRKFMADHLGRWAFPFAELLAGKDEAGHLGATAALARAFLDHELALLRARSERVSLRPTIAAPDPDDFGCPLAQGSSAAEAGGADAAT
jgi:TorA maturation chaperone TorD